MALFSRLTCLAVVALFCVTPRSVAGELPMGVWKIRAAGNWQGELVIQAVKADGEVEGKAFGKPIHGTWDGTKLSFKFRDITEHWYEGWLVQEKLGKRNRYTLTGVRKQLTLYPVNDNYWPEAGGWYAQLDRKGRSDRSGRRRFASTSSTCWPSTYRGASSTRRCAPCASCTR